MVAKAIARDETKEHVARERLGQQGRGSCSCRRFGDEVATDDGGCAKPEKSRHDIETADEHHGPHHTGARGPGVRHGVEADENVW